MGIDWRSVNHSTAAELGLIIHCLSSMWCVCVCLLVCSANQRWHWNEKSIFRGHLPMNIVVMMARQNRRRGRGSNLRLLRHRPRFCRHGSVGGNSECGAIQRSFPRRERESFIPKDLTGGKKRKAIRISAGLWFVVDWRPRRNFAVRVSPTATPVSSPRRGLKRNHIRGDVFRSATKWLLGVTDWFRNKYLRGFLKGKSETNFVANITKHQVKFIKETGKNSR